MATYGLRPSECDDCTLLTNESPMLVQVADETKTGFRTVIPQEEAWVELFDLQDRQTRPDTERDADRNDATSVWLNRWRLKQKLQWKPYALRHAYAGRLWRNGGAELDVFDAAQLMGHSQKEHIETYRKWIYPNKIAVSALAAIKRNQAKVKEDLAQTLHRGRCTNAVPIKCRESARLQLRRPGSTALSGATSNKGIDLANEDFPMLDTQIRKLAT